MNSSVPLGRERFTAETGIQFSDWHGKYWARWGDALIEAGYSPNKLQGAYDVDWIIEKFIVLMRELGRFPVGGEIKIKSSQDKDFPSHGVFRRLGKKTELAAKVIEYCKARDNYDDVIEICEPIAIDKKIETKKTIKDNSEIGYVYLMKSGRYYKIGRSSSVERRNYDLGIILPEEIKIIHKIETDDPVGIEGYWHNRFDKKRKKGEWFELSSIDVTAFKKWKRIV